MPKKLWDYKHEYYCNDANYYSYDSRQELDSWEDFLAEWGDADEDYNLLFRWDCERDGKKITLKLFYMLQRKGNFFPVTVHNIKEEQEADIIKFLQPKAQYMMDLWSPLCKTN